MEPNRWWWCNTIKIFFSFYPTFAFSFAIHQSSISICFWILCVFAIKKLDLFLKMPHLFLHRPKSKLLSFLSKIYGIWCAHNIVYIMVMCICSILQNGLIFVEILSIFGSTVNVWMLHATRKLVSNLSKLIYKIMTRLYLHISFKFCVCVDDLVQSATVHLFILGFVHLQPQNLFQHFQIQIECATFTTSTVHWL